MIQNSIYNKNHLNLKRSDISNIIYWQIPFEYHCALCCDHICALMFQLFVCSRSLYMCACVCPHGPEFIVLSRSDSAGQTRCYRLQRNFMSEAHPIVYSVKQVTHHSRSDTTVSTREEFMYACAVNGKVRCFYLRALLPSTQH